MGYDKIIILALLVGLPSFGLLLARSRIRRISRSLLGTPNLIKGLTRLERESYNTPFSVSGGTSVYLPKIKRDFPDFEFIVMSKKVEQFFISYFDAMEKRSAEPLRKVEMTEAVESKIRFEIEDMEQLEETVSIDRVKTNGISIWDYRKSETVVTITFQISMGYQYGKESPKGTESGVSQVKYELDMSYLFEEHTKESFALKCANCGGPIRDTQTSCPFCGTGFVRNIEMVWRVSGFEELRRAVWKDSS